MDFSGLTGQSHFYAAGVDPIFSEDINITLDYGIIAPRDSHVFWTVGFGHTEFTDSSAADLSAALENLSTAPIPSEKKFNLLPIIGWMGHITLRRFVYVAENNSPQDPVKIQ
jgi:hypothetical protein